MHAIMIMLPFLPVSESTARVNERASRPRVRATFLLAVIAVAGAIPAARAAAADSLLVLETTVRPLLYGYLIGEVSKQYAERRGAVQEALSSAEAMAARRDRLCQEFRELIGGLPERTPLNARTLGVIDCERYRIE